MASLGTLTLSLLDQERALLGHVGNVERLRLHYNGGRALTVLLACVMLVGCFLENWFCASVEQLLKDTWSKLKVPGLREGSPKNLPEQSDSDPLYFFSFQPIGIKRQCNVQHVIIKWVTTIMSAVLLK